MNKWYMVTVSYIKEYDNGTIGRVSEPYLLNATSYADAEKRIYTEVGEYQRGEFFVKDIKQKQYADLFHYEDAKLWFECKVAYVTEDADSGKERKQSHKFLISAHNVKEAYERLEESVKGILYSFQIPEIKLTKIVEIFIGDGYQTNLMEQIKEEE